MLQPYIKTERLILREITEDDATDFLRLESHPAVQHYIRKDTMKTIDEAMQVINSIREDYTKYGIARWAVIEKSSGLFAGFAGTRFHPETLYNHTNFYELGYRFFPEHWGKGYASEASKHALDHCFNNFNPSYIYGFTDIGNLASKKVMTKLGFSYVEDFDFNNALMSWYKLKQPTSMSDSQ